MGLDSQGTCGRPTLPCLGPGPGGWSGGLDSHSLGDVAACAELSSRGDLGPSSGQGSRSQLSLQSDDGGSFVGGDRELSVHRAASVWELPTGVVPPEDSPPRDSSSSLWASSMSLSLCSLRVSS